MKVIVTKPDLTKVTHEPCHPSVDPATWALSVDELASMPPVVYAAGEWVKAVITP